RFAQGAVHGVLTAVAGTARDAPVAPEVGPFGAVLHHGSCGGDLVQQEQPGGTVGAPMTLPAAALHPLLAAHRLQPYPHSGGVRAAAAGVGADGTRAAGLSSGQTRSGRSPIRS